MHAVRITTPGGPEALQYVECDKPKPTPNTVLVKNKSIGINYIDVYHRTGFDQNNIKLILRNLPSSPSVYDRS